MSLQTVSQVQLELAKRLYGKGTEFKRLLKAYTLWHKVNLAYRYSTYDSVFFIINEGIGFKAIKFYNDGVDIRISGHKETLSDAYNEAVHVL